MTILEVMSMGRVKMVSIFHWLSRREMLHFAVGVLRTLFRPIFGAFFGMLRNLCSYVQKKSYSTSSLVCWLLRNKRLLFYLFSAFPFFLFFAPINLVIIISGVYADREYLVHEFSHASTYVILFLIYQPRVFLWPVIYQKWRIRWTLFLTRFAIF